ncbi:hypothetical protein V3C99_001797 [Haemonchus contortus]
MGSTILGLGACALSSLFFGTAYVPIKRFDASNGIFVQWVMSAGILCVGMVVNAFEEFPKFQPFAMVGGALWALGNFTAVPIMNVLGLGMGMLIWGTTNCVCGWSVGRFGLFGVKAFVPAMPLLNYLGLVMVIIGGFFFSQLRPTVSTPTAEEIVIVEESSRPVRGDSDEDSPLLASTVPVGLDRRTKRLIAVMVALMAGIFYGVTFVPVIYMQDHPEQNNPVVNNKITGPSLLAGCMWAIAQTSWFFANDNLSQSISFPITSMLPGVCAALWSVFYFKEITGHRNLRILTIAVCTTLTGAVLVGLSK